MSLLTSRISPVGQAGRVKRLHASGVVGIELSEGQPLQWPGRVVTPGRAIARVVQNDLLKDSSTRAAHDGRS